MQLRKAGRVTALFAAAALVGATAAPSAYADAHAEGTPQQIKTKRSSALFYDIDEDLEARDIRADGYGARAYLRFGGHTSSAYANNGEGDRDVVDLNIPEGMTVYLQLCYTKNGVDVKCSKPQKGFA
jgi:hypothetical protein